MVVSEPNKKLLSREKTLTTKNKQVFCLDCVIDWCKIRNKVTYCSQKYKGTTCYNCEDGKCTVKRLASS